MAGLSILFSSDVAFFIPAITKVLNARANKAPPTKLLQAIAITFYLTKHQPSLRGLKITIKWFSKYFYLFVPICEIQAVILDVRHVFL